MPKKTSPDETKKKACTYMSILEIECPHCMKEFKITWKDLRTQEYLECPKCFHQLSCAKILSDLNEQMEGESKQESKETS